MTDLDSALKAIDEIVKEGEGSSRCNPFNFYEKQAQLSHYYLFKCVAEEHQLRVHPGKGNTVSKKCRTDRVIQSKPLCEPSCELT